MAVTFSISDDLYGRICDHLAGTAEQVAFFLAQRSDGRVDHLRLVDAYMVADGLEPDGPFHVHLADEVQGQVIRWAWSADASLVEAHSHGPWGDPAAFSPTDLDGLAEWVPHVWWRLGGRPYAALVFGAQTFDGLAWTRSPTTAEPVDLLRIDGRPPRAATGRSHARLQRRARPRRSSPDVPR
jgi:hypothetical protein